MNRGVSPLLSRTTLSWFGGLSLFAALWTTLGTCASAQAATPQITQQPSDRIIAVGSNASFTVIATGDEPLTYQWYFDLLTAIPNGTNATLVLTNVQPANAGTYQDV